MTRKELKEKGIDIPQSVFDRLNIKETKNGTIIISSKAPSKPAIWVNEVKIDKWEPKPFLD